jgi:hypothetical protein
MAEDNGTTMNYRFTARGGLDEKGHLVNAPVAAIAHPSAHTTWCGQPVVNICRDGDPVTCPACARQAGGAPATSGASNAELLTGQQVR